MDIYIGIGAAAFLVLGIIAYLKPDLLWRIYRIEPRWRRDNAEKPSDWPRRARRQGYYFIGISIAAFLFGLAIGTPGS